MAPKESDPLDTPTILSEKDDYYGGVTPDDESIVSLLLMKPWNDEDSMIHDRTDAKIERSDAAPASPVPPVILTEKDFYDALPPLNQEQDEIDELAAAALLSPKPNSRILNFRGSRIIMQQPSPTPDIDDALFQDVCIDLEKEVSYESIPSLYFDDFGGFAATAAAPAKTSTHSSPPTAPTIARKGSQATKPASKSNPTSAASLQQKKRLRNAINREFPLPSIRIDSDVMKHLARKLDQLKSELADVRWKMEQQEQQASKQTKTSAAKKRRHTARSPSAGEKNAKRKRLVEVDGMKVFV